MRFTDRYLAGLKPKDSRYHVWEGNGFGCRVGTTGKVSFVWVFHFEGHPRFMTLGTYSPKTGDSRKRLTLAQARRKLGEAQELLEQGIDPAGKHVEERKAERQGMRVKDLSESFLRLYSRPSKRTRAEYKRMLDRYVLPEIGRRKAITITSRDVTAILDKIATRAPIQANRVRAVLSKIFNWALPREIVTHNPVLATERPEPERVRERKLTDKTIADWWKSLDKADVSEPLRNALRLALVTGARRSEIAGINLSEIDLVGRVWTIPAERSKNGKPHEVPLSDLAVALIRNSIKARPKKRAANSPWLFIGTEGRSLNPQALTRAMVRNTGKVGRITPHDLRRSAATGLQRLGVPADTIAAILNHSAQSVTTRHYAQADLGPQKKVALDAWAKHLESLLPDLSRDEGGKVVNLR